jgi:hypothetical protein
MSVTVQPLYLQKENDLERNRRLRAGHVPLSEQPGSHEGQISITALAGSFKNSHAH